MMNSPQEDIKLPAELAKAIERSRNVVTINESESARLGELIMSREYTIREQQKEIASNEEKLALQKGQLSKAEIALNGYNKEIAEKTNAKIKIENEHAIVQGSLKSLRDFLYAN